MLPFCLLVLVGGWLMHGSEAVRSSRVSPLPQISVEADPVLNAVDMNALKELFYATNGPFWSYANVTGAIFDVPNVIDRVAWNFSNPNANPCTEGWTGVDCERPSDQDEYYVHRLDLEYFNMSGMLPSSIGDFQMIQEISMLDNYLSGTIPPSVGNLTLLKGLYFDINDLTGPIPSTIASLHLLLGFGCSVNAMTGTIPEIGNLLQLRRLDIDKNMFSQTIPASLGNLNSLNLLYLFENRFTGPLPEELGQLLELQGLYMSDNHFTGALPDSLNRLADLKYLYMHHNRLSGTIPASYSGMSKLETMALNDNYLGGAIPTSLANISSLLVLQLQSNYLEGSLEGVLDPARQPKLNSIQVSDNMLTGQLPDNLPAFRSLHSFTAVSNCIQGSLPTSLCAAGSLYNLILDGLGSARGCNTMLLPGVSNAYESLNIVKGGVPACLFQLPNLTSLHLSGNGFTGTLPGDVELGPYLIDLALSHNRLTGTIPLNIQERRWYQLDLSYNFLAGTLSTDFASVRVNRTHFSETHPVLGSLNLSVVKEVLGGISAYTDVTLSPLVYLENNRLSGRLPGYLNTVGDVSVLGSNLFQCNVWRTNLPQHDDGRNHYQCGSDSFNNPYYIWLILMGIALVLGACLYKMKFESSRQVQFAISTVWKAVLSTLPTDQPAATLHVGAVFRVYDFLCSVGAAAVAFMLVVLMPCYIGFSVYSGTLTHQYAWVASAAYISGTLPFAAMIILLTCLLAIVSAAFAHQYGVLIQHVVPLSPQRWSARFRSTVSGGSSSDLASLSREVARDGSGKEEGHSSSDRSTGSGKLRPYSLDREALKAQLSGAKLFAIYAIFLAVNLTVVVGVNVSFVLIAIYRSNNELVVSQIAISIFKIWWNSVCARWIIRYTAKVITRTSDSSAARHVDFVSLQLFVSLFNNIVIPSLVVMVVSPGCFYNVLRAAPAVVSKEAVVSCFALSPLGQCRLSVPQVSVTSYNPPFDYSYQCSSSLITYYAPAFVSLSIVSTFLTPSMQYLLAALHRRASPETRWRSLVGYFLPHILKVHALDEPKFLLKLKQRVLFDPNSHLIQLITYIGVLLTFGAVFPPLAAALVVAMIAVTIVAKMSISVFMQGCFDRRLAHIVQHVNAECKGVASNVVLYNALWMLISVSCIFYTIFLFDTLGDAVGWYGAYWLFIVMPLMPLALFALFHVYSYFRPDALALGDKEGRNSGVEMSGRGDTLTGLYESDLEGGGGPRSTFSPLSQSLSLPSLASRQQQHRALPAVPVSVNAGIASAAVASPPIDAEHSETVKEKSGASGPESTPERPDPDEVVVVHNILRQPSQN